MLVCLVRENTMFLFSKHLSPQDNPYTKNCLFSECKHRPLAPLNRAIYDLRFLARWSISRIYTGRGNLRFSAVSDWYSKDNCRVLELLVCYKTQGVLSLYDKVHKGLGEMLKSAHIISHRYAGK